MNHFAAHLKLIQYCKWTIINKKKNYYYKNIQSFPSHSHKIKKIPTWPVKFLTLSLQRDQPGQTAPLRFVAGNKKASEKNREYSGKSRQESFQGVRVTEEQQQRLCVEEETSEEKGNLENITMVYKDPAFLVSVKYNIIHVFWNETLVFFFNRGIG